MWEARRIGIAPASTAPSFTAFIQREFVGEVNRLNDGEHGANERYAEKHHGGGMFRRQHQPEKSGAGGEVGPDPFAKCSGGEDHWDVRDSDRWSSGGPAEESTY